MVSLPFQHLSSSVETVSHVATGFNVQNWILGIFVGGSNINMRVSVLHRCCPRLQIKPVGSICVFGTFLLTTAFDAIGDGREGLASTSSACNLLGSIR